MLKNLKLIVSLVLINVLVYPIFIMANDEVPLVMEDILGEKEESVILEQVNVEIIEKLEEIIEPIVSIEILNQEQKEELKEELSITDEETKEEKVEETTKEETEVKEDTKLEVEIKDELEQKTEEVTTVETTEVIEESIEEEEVFVDFLPSIFIDTFKIKKIEKSYNISPTKINRQDIDFVGKKPKKNNINELPVNNISIFNENESLVLKGQCNNEYWTVLVYENKDDYLNNKSAYVYNKADKCSVGEYSYELNLPASIKEGKYYAVVAESNLLGKWQTLSDVLEFDININTN